jgi:hypothetical protein
MKNLQYIFSGDGYACFIDCSVKSDEEMWGLILDISDAFDGPQDCLRAFPKLLSKRKKDFFSHSGLNSSIAVHKGNFDIVWGTMGHFSKGISICGHHGRYEQQDLDFMKKIIEKTIGAS